jgi:hypothetical protein
MGEFLVSGLAVITGNVPKNTSQPRRKVKNPNLGFLASYARIAIHIGEFSHHNAAGTQNARTKIAQ